MKTKYVNNFLNVLIVVAVLYFGYISAKYVSSFAAPNYEVVDLGIKWNYEFTEKDGRKVTSYYFPAWHDGKAVAYDPVYDKSVDFNEEYVNEITAKMPKSQYGIFSRWANLLSWVTFIIVGLLIWFLCIYIKEFLLAVYASVTKRFADVAYFFKEKRWAGNSIARKVYQKEVGNYVLKKRREIERMYQPENARMITGMLDYMRYAQSPRIPYLLKIKNVTTKQVSYLNNLISYWETQIGKDNQAESNINYLRSLREKNYAEYAIFTKDSAIAPYVSTQLEKIFEKLMGEQIFSFEPYIMHFSPELKVELELLNSLSTFTWNGTGHAGETFPGIDVKMTISRKGKELWSKFLRPISTYTAEENSMVVSDFYENMIQQTISTFAEVVK